MHSVARFNSNERKPNPGCRELSMIFSASFMILLINGLFWFGYCNRKISLALMVFILSLGVIAAFFGFRKNNSRFKEPRAFIALLVGFGVAFGLVFTPFSVPDEDFHFSASYALSNFLMGKGYQSSDPVLMREDDAHMFEDMDTSLKDAEYLKITDGFTSLFSASAKEVEVVTGRSHSITGNPPQAKIVSAVAITIARLFNLSSVYLFYLGRFANLALYVVLIWLAYRITPIGKNAVMVLSLLPMSLHLAASYSYDAFIIPMSFLLTAECLRAIKSKGKIAKREVVQITVTAALLAPCKVIYVLLAFLALFIPNERFGGRRRGYRIKLICCALIAAFLILVKLGDVVSTIGGVSQDSSGLDYRGAESGYFYSVSDVLNSPIKFAIILLRTLDTYGFYYLSTLIGGSLGWFQGEIAAPGFIVVAYFVLIIYSMLASSDDCGELCQSVKATGIAIFIIGSLAVFASLLFSWTFNTEQIILGVQGRYFIPYLMLLLVSLRPKRLFFDGDAGGIALFCIYNLNAMYLVRIFAIALTL